MGPKAFVNFDADLSFENPVLDVVKSCFVCPIIHSRQLKLESVLLYP